MEQFIFCTIQLFISLLFLSIIVINLSKHIKEIAKDKHENEKSKDLKVHIMYVSVIASLIIVSLATYICIGNYKKDDIMDYISFAGTLSSLILSVVAIIFTIVLSKTGAEQNEKMNEAIITLQSSIQDFQDKTNQLKAIADKLSEIENKVNETNKSVSKITANNDMQGSVIQSSVLSEPVTMGASIVPSNS